MTSEHFKEISRKADARIDARKAERERRMAELAFIINVPADRIMEVMVHLDGKATIREMVYWEDNTNYERYTSAEGAAYDRLQSDQNTKTNNPFVVVFHDEKDAAMFRLFFEDIATKITEDDWQVAAREREEEAAQRLAMEAEREATKHIVDLTYAGCWCENLNGVHIQASDPTSPRVTIK